MLKSVYGADASYSWRRFCSLDSLPHGRAAIRNHNFDPMLQVRTGRLRDLGKSKRSSFARARIKRFLFSCGKESGGRTHNCLRVRKTSFRTYGLSTKFGASDRLVPIGSNANR